MKRLAFIALIISLAIAGCGSNLALKKRIDSDSEIASGGDEVPIGGSYEQPDYDGKTPVEDDDVDLVTPSPSNKAPGYSGIKKKSQSTGGAFTSLKITKSSLGTWLFGEKKKVKIVAMGSASRVKWSAKGLPGGVKFKSGMLKIAYLEGAVDDTPGEYQISITASSIDNPSDTHTKVLTMTVTDTLGMEFYQENEGKWNKVGTEKRIDLGFEEVLRIQAVGKFNSFSWSLNNASGVEILNSDPSTGESAPNSSFIFVSATPGNHENVEVTVESDVGNEETVIIDLAVTEDSCAIPIALKRKEHNGRWKINHGTTAESVVPFAIGVSGGSGKYNWEVTEKSAFSGEGIEYSIEKHEAEGLLSGEIKFTLTGECGLGCLPFGETAEWEITVTDATDACPNTTSDTATLSIELEMDKKNWSFDTFDYLLVAGMNQIRKKHTKLDMVLTSEDGGVMADWDGFLKWYDFNGGSRQANGKCYFNDDGREARDYKCGKKITPRDMTLKWDQPKDLGNVNMVYVDHHDKEPRKKNLKGVELWVHVIQLKAAKGTIEWCADVRYEGNPTISEINTSRGNASRTDWECYYGKCTHGFPIDWMPCDVVEAHVGDRWWNPED